MSVKTQAFITKARLIHGDRYDYSKVEYTNAKAKITIICKQHGEFQQTPCNHLSKYNCNKCANNAKLTTEQFIEKAIQVHGDKYDYSKVDYKNTDDKIIIVCKEHGDFLQIPDFHINRKTGCSKCANNSKLGNELFIEKANQIHGDKYDYANVDYSNNRTHVSIGCKKHGDFLQIPYVHLLGHGCPHCINKTEHKFLVMLLEKCPTIQHQFKVKWCKRKLCLPFDFVIEDKKIIIELDGEQHYKQVANWTAPEIQQEVDAYKMKMANENGYSVIRVLQQSVMTDDGLMDKIMKQISELEGQVKNVCID
jgi:very-short-patch-repair endonuclease